MVSPMTDFEIAYEADFQEVMERITPGHKYRLVMGENNVNNRLIHILSVVDGDYFVCKCWAKRKRVWFYYVENWYYFHLRLDKLTEVR